MTLAGCKARVCGLVARPIVFFSAWPGLRASCQANQLSTKRYLAICYNYLLVRVAARFIFVTPSGVLQHTISIERIFNNKLFPAHRGAGFLVYSHVRLEQQRYAPRHREEVSCLGAFKKKNQMEKVSEDVFRSS